MSETIEPELPPIDAITQPWWDATRDGVLVIQLCQSCGHFQHYPRALCTGCGGTDLGWEQVAQYGVVDSFTVVHRGLPGFDAPYVVARVRLPLPNRVHLLTNIVDTDHDAIRCDQVVQLRWKPLSDGRQLPVYALEPTIPPRSLIVTVRAVVLREFGDLGAGGLAVEDWREPEPGVDGEILVELLAADLQPLDRQIARGFLPGAGPLPMVAGVSAVGRTTGSGRTVVVLGELTGRGIGRDGLFADRFVVDATQIQVAPPQLDPRAIAAGAALGMHARHTLFEVAGARRGQHVLVLGATGGFGHAVMSTAHSEGLKVIAAARRPELVKAPPGVHVLGLDDLADLAPRVKELTDGHGVDVIVDPLGGAVTGAAVRCGARACRHVLLGHAAGVDAVIPVPAMMLGEHRILGVNGFLITASDQHAYLREAMADMVAGHHVPLIGASVDLGEAPQAYAAADALHGRTILVGAALGDASTAVDHPAAAAAPAPGRHDHHHGDHDHGEHTHTH